jgi:hypothetical protein
MKPVIKENGVISAFCPDCGVLSNFTTVTAPQVPQHHDFNGKDYNNIFYPFLQCVGCRRGGIAKVHSSGEVWATTGFLEWFFPFYRNVAPLPPSVQVT